MGSTISTITVTISTVNAHCQYMTMELDKICLGGHGKTHIGHCIRCDVTFFTAVCFYQRDE